MSRRAGLVLFAGLVVLFLIVNRGAYQGYFQDDEIDNIAWTRHGHFTDYLTAALSPRFSGHNFRPAGHYYFHAAEAAFHLDFPKYVAVLQGFHLLNVWLVWAVARRLGAAAWTVCAASLFFAFHMALFDAFWKPMYVFDVLCGGLCLLSLLLYMHRRLVLSFVAFWLAYKAKELAVMLPVAIACYELWFGKRQWRRLAPWLAVSLSFGLQGLIMSPNRDNPYALQFTPGAVAKTSAFYAARVFLVPYAGFVLPFAALTARNRRTWFGLAMAAAFFIPLLILPERLFSAYCYVPFMGLAIAFAGIAEAASPAVVALFFLLWIPQDLEWLRAQRRATLAQAAEVRTWMSALADFAKRSPTEREFVYEGAPTGFAGWGMEGALKYFFGPDVKVSPASPDGQARRPILLRWHYYPTRLEIIRGGAP